MTLVNSHQVKASIMLGLLGGCGGLGKQLADQRRHLTARHSVLLARSHFPNLSMSIRETSLDDQELIAEMKIFVETRRNEP